MADTASEHDHLRFALALHGALRTGAENSCFSPYSVASALGLVARGARGTTAEELAALLVGEHGDHEGQADLLRAAATLRAKQGQDEPVLAVANTLWAWDGLEIKDEFRDELAAWPGGNVAKAPFVDDPEGARRLINADVATATNDLIPELLQPGTVHEDTVASLVNALYLRVGFTLPFSVDATTDAEFHAPAGTVRVPTMHQHERLGYAALRGWQVVALNAAGGVQATVLLPDGDLADAESALDASTLAELLSAPEEAMVDLAVPKLDLDARSALTDALRELGVRRLFTRAAELEGLSDDDRLCVDAVLHQAVLRMDERGLEGAAATAVMMRLVSMPMGEPVTVRVDRPFLLLVRHAGTGAVYFLARVTTP